MLCERFHSPKRLRQRKQTCRRQEPLSRSLVSPNPERYHPAVRKVERRVAVVGLETVHELLRVRRERLVRQLVARVCLQPGVYHLLHVLAALERTRDLQRILAVRLHAQVERLGPPLREPAVVRAGNRTACILQELQLLVHRKVAMRRRQNQCTHEHIRMAVDVFRHRVHDEVGTEQQGRRIERGEERVVHKHQGLGWVRFSQSGDFCDIDEA